MEAWSVSVEQTFDGGGGIGVMRSLGEIEVER